ncbi:MAG TPA: nucleoside deaminase [Cellvibrionaceae bacterium]
MNDLEQHRHYLDHCITLARQSAEAGGGPFAALVVKDGEVIAEACNRVTKDCDPTAHAEVSAIRAACRVLESHQLDGCIIYSSCEPCPMCLGAIYWARAKAVYYAATRYQAADAGFDDSLVYREIATPDSERLIPFVHLQTPLADAPFSAWNTLADKVRY